MVKLKLLKREIFHLRIPHFSIVWHILMLPSLNASCHWSDPRDSRIGHFYYELPYNNFWHSSYSLERAGTFPVHLNNFHNSWTFFLLNRERRSTWNAKYENKFWIDSREGLRSSALDRNIIFSIKNAS